MLKLNFIHVFVLMVLALTPGSLNAKLQLGSLFTDHMVLQCDKAVPVWGKANPGSQITVDFAGQTKKTTVNSQGKWMLELDPLSASFQAQSMTVQSSLNSSKLSFSDVLVGEVWICSGQSNMQMAAGSVPAIKALIPSANNIRSFTVENTVAFSAQDFCKGSWNQNIPKSAIAFGFSYFLQKSAKVPVGIILTSWGSSSQEAWMPRQMTESVPHFKTMMQEFDADTTTKNKIKTILEGPKPWSKNDDVFLRRQSNILYNAMMHPLAPYACRGLVWYQGERNTQSMHGMVKSPWFSRNSGMLKYGDSLKSWIQYYRKVWKSEDLHFLVVMLPGYAKGLKEGPEDPAAQSWAWMRESQLKVLQLPHTGVVNSIDLGDITNIHPKDKLPITERLALLAARDTLGHKIEAQGPLVNKVEQKANSLIIHFDHGEGLRTKDTQNPRGFWIADENKKWVPAKASIVGETVVLTSSEITKPLYVRYAFSGKPTVNLVNAAQLPAYPFRTDSFAP